MQLFKTEILFLNSKHLQMKVHSLKRKYSIQHGKQQEQSFNLSTLLMIKYEPKPSSLRHRHNIF